MIKRLHDGMKVFARVDGELTEPFDGSVVSGKVVFWLRCFSICFRVQLLIIGGDC